MRWRLTSMVILGLGLSLAAPARACSISREPYGRALRTAHPAVAACEARFGLPAGRYVMRVAVDPSGKATEVAVSEAPGELDAAAESCLEMAFTLPGYPATERPASRGARSGGGRLSRVPPPARLCDGPVVISWPFVLR
ncbi:MAG: hypothetical protein SangKO_081510 [Sandaracinaceae bacterium]